MQLDHASNPRWGTTGQRYAGYIKEMCERLNTCDVLDYGCGKGTLSDALGISVFQYDPGIEEHSALPDPHDLVISTDVLEHVEPACIDYVLEHIRSLTKAEGFHAISTAKAHHRLPDGRNAHILVRDAGWWKERLEIAGFAVADVRLPINAPRYEEIVYTCFVSPK